ncbi:hypothetical protein Bca4012_055240 [Brassica carinata]
MCRAANGYRKTKTRQMIQGLHQSTHREKITEKLQTETIAKQDSGQEQNKFKRRRAHIHNTLMKAPGNNHKSGKETRKPQKNRERKAP